MTPAGGDSKASSMVTVGAPESDGEGRDGVAGAPAPAAMKKGPWTATEDAVLVDYVKKHGEGNWNAVQRNTGLSRCGKSCRLRWRTISAEPQEGLLLPDEERLILELHSKMGNKWARMAAQLPGRTDNEIKNYWNTRIKRRQRAGLPLYPPEVHRQTTFHYRPPQATSGAPPPPPPPPELSATNFSLFDFAGAQPFLFQSTAAVNDDTSFFSVGFGSVAAPQAPSPSQSPPLFQLSTLGNYDLNPPPSPPLLREPQNFSVKMELPSSQLFQETHSIAISGAGAGGGAVCRLPLERSSSDLLDAFLRDTQQVGCSSNSLRGGNSVEHHHHHLNFILPEPIQHQRIDREQSPALVLDSGGLWLAPNRPPAGEFLLPP
ncbi:unnamed protein product [Spirodela intermedia]|uniref:Transcription factor GAMYB n=1 Tax=Spirodela intermedia TaxID=51605 RepID=A0A7I8IJW4_SPIIN|nr:unnamed protein product [Spirodela intermedia]CAA6658169.1 unnamed protein product [Spirodela intermedia]